jgi:hypothetical protein
MKLKKTLELIHLVNFVSMEKSVFIIWLLLLYHSRGEWPFMVAGL